MYVNIPNVYLKEVSKAAGSPLLKFTPEQEEDPRTFEGDGMEVWEITFIDLNGGKVKLSRKKEGSSEIKTIEGVRAAAWPRTKLSGDTSGKENVFASVRIFTSPPSQDKSSLKKSSKKIPIFTVPHSVKEKQIQKDIKTAQKTMEKIYTDYLNSSGHHKNVFDASEKAVLSVAFHKDKGIITEQLKAVGSKYQLNELKLELEKLVDEKRACLPITLFEHNKTRREEVEKKIKALEDEMENNTVELLERKYFFNKVNKISNKLEDVIKNKLAKQKNPEKDLLWKDIKRDVYDLNEKYKVNKANFEKKQREVAEIWENTVLDKLISSNSELGRSISATISVPAMSTPLARASVIHASAGPSQSKTAGTVVSKGDGKGPEPANILVSGSMRGPEPLGSQPDSIDQIQERMSNLAQLDDIARSLGGVNSEEGQVSVQETLLLKQLSSVHLPSDNTLQSFYGTKAAEEVRDLLAKNYIPTKQNLNLQSSSSKFNTVTRYFGEGDEFDPLKTVFYNGFGLSDTELQPGNPAFGVNIHVRDLVSLGMLSQSDLDGMLSKDSHGPSSMVYCTLNLEGKVPVNYALSTAEDDESISKFQFDTVIPGVELKSVIQNGPSLTTKVINLGWNSMYKTGSNGHTFSNVKILSTNLNNSYHLYPATQSFGQQLNSRNFYNGFIIFDDNHLSGGEPDFGINVAPDALVDAGVLSITEKEKIMESSLFMVPCSLDLDYNKIHPNVRYVGRMSGDPEVPVDGEEENLEYDMQVDNVELTIDLKGVKKTERISMVWSNTY